MKKYILMSALALGLCMTSCDSYLDINQDPQSPSEGNVTSSMLVPGTEMAIANAYGNYLRTNLAIIGTMQIKDAEGNITYTDPRLEKFFEANKDGKYVGGVSGTNYPSTTSLTKWCRPIEEAKSPLYLLTKAETEFFISEYYARTNDEANATAHYNKAIEESFASAGADGAAEHIAKFPFDMSNYKKSIGVQKWIALAGTNTFEAWCEVRRLDYPAFDTNKKGEDFYKKGNDSSFNDTGYQAGTLYTPIDVFSQVGNNKLLERFPYAEVSSARNSNTPEFTNADYTKPVFWGE